MALKTLFHLVFIGIVLFNKPSFAASHSKQPPLKLEELTISQFHQALTKQQINVTKLVEHYLSRISALNKQGPMLNAIISINPNALNQAKQLDEQLSTDPQHTLLPLFGVPVLLKDNIESADPIATTAGSLALADNFAKQDAALVAQLRQAGAIILGKTNLSEWANFRSTNSSSGWSAIGGQTRNPYVLTQSSCGSSSGTGTAISANLALVGVGTETDGSIICPSSATGLIGVKPTVGLVSGLGIIPLAASQDTAGPMTRTVTDAAHLLQSMLSKDSAKPISLGQAKESPDYSKHLIKNGLKGKTIGIIANSFKLHPKVATLFEAAKKDLLKQGAILKPELIFEVEPKVFDAEYEVLLYEFKAQINQYLSSKKLGVKSLSDLIKFNQRNKQQELTFFGQEIFLAAEQKGPITEPDYQLALKYSQATMRKAIDDFMNEHQLDVIAVASLNPAWSIDLINGDRFTGSSSSYAAISGYPSISVPMGFVHQLPVGISFIAKSYQEPLLFEVAYGYEQATQHRQPPKLIPNLSN